MNKIFSITDNNLPHIQSAFNALIVMDEKPHVCQIKPADTSLSAQQRKYYFVILGIIGVELGDDKDYYHLFYKKKYLIKIYERDDEEFARMIEAVRAVHLSGNKTNAKYLADQIVKLTSIRDATTKQMAEYLDSIIKDAAGLGITLPMPDNHKITEYRELS